MRAVRYLVPFGVASALFGVVSFLLIRHGLAQNGGVFTYPLDDAYIHLAVSRNLALHGVWGIDPYTFSGASSSPGWTLLLAGLIRIFGVHLLMPLIANIVAAVLLLLVATIVLARALPQAGTLFLAAALCVLVLFVPLPGLAVVGMEHVSHGLAVLCLVAIGSWIASRTTEDRVSPALAAALIASAAVCGALRYESCFVVIVTAIVLLIRRHAVVAILMAAASAIGPATYGAYSYAHSHLPLPFSVVMKSSSSSPSLNSLLNSPVSPIILLLAAASLLRLSRRSAAPAASREPFWSFGQTFLLIALATTCIQSIAGPVGWLLRYESYLYALGIVAFTLVLGEELALYRTPSRSPFSPAERWAVAATIVALLPVAMEILHRGHHGWSDVATSIHDRYVEHLPQALFVGQNMPHAVVVANDIGFLAFYAPDARILDPLGLGSIEPVDLKLHHQNMNLTFLDKWAAHDNAQLAIGHSDFPGTPLLTDWVLVESWCFPSNLVFLNHVESFYAPDPKSAATLREQMANFKQVSPEIVRYRFPEDGTEPPTPARGENSPCPVPASRANVGMSNTKPGTTP